MLNTELPPENVNNLFIGIVMQPFLAMSVGPNQDFELVGVVVFVRTTCSVQKRRLY